jgi:hypothetical protein
MESRGKGTTGAFLEETHVAHSSSTVNYNGGGYVPLLLALGKQNSLVHILRKELHRGISLVEDKIAIGSKRLVSLPRRYANDLAVPKDLAVEHSVFFLLISHIRHITHWL